MIVTGSRKFKKEAFSELGSFYWMYSSTERKVQSN